MKKIFDIEKLKKKLQDQKINKKNIILCHGVFDLIHYGHLKYFEFAKKLNSCGEKNFLIVSTTADLFIKKGFGRPYFNQNQRLEMLSNIDMIDAVVLSNNASSENIIKNLKPGYYVKGLDYKDNTKDKTGKIYLEKKAVEKYGGKIVYSNTQINSSSKILNNSTNLFSNKQKEILNYLKNKKLNFYRIENLLNSLSSLEVTVLGEIIFDEYNFGNVIGKSGKEPHLVHKFSYKETYAGGSAAVARHLSNFIKSINLISFFGYESEYKLLLKKDLGKNINFLSFKPDKNFHSIVKKRFIDFNSFYKLFGSYHLPDINSLKNDRLIIKKLKNIKNKIIIITDYGHGLISKKITDFLKKKGFYLAVNSQLNSSNIGSHNLNKYSGADLVVINENELRNELKDDKEKIELLSRNFMNKRKIKNLVITRGSNGAIMIDKKNIFYCPAFIGNAVDKIGAGDAMLSIITVCLYNNFDKQLSLFLGCIAGYFSVKNLGNKKSLNKSEFLNFLEYATK